MRGSRAERLWVPQYRALITGLVLTITFVASEALAVVTVMPVAARDLGGLKLYGWVFSGFMLGSVASVGVGRPGGRPARARGPVRGRPAAVRRGPAGGRAGPGHVGDGGRAGAAGCRAGAVPAVAYAAIGRCLPGPLRPG